MIVGGIYGLVFMVAVWYANKRYIKYIVKKDVDKLMIEIRKESDKYKEK